MRNVFRRPSASMVVAVTALIFAASGTAVAASNLVSGDKLIKKHSVSGNRLRNHTITGKQVNLNKLGKVPSARNADHATSADTATSATSATTATTAGSAPIAKLTYASATFVVPDGGTADVRASGTASCPAGTFVTGGGSSSPDESTANTDYLIDSHPTSDRRGWTATVENENTPAVTETVWAVCAPAAATG